MFPRAKTSASAASRGPNGGGEVGDILRKSGASGVCGGVGRRGGGEVDESRGSCRRRKRRIGIEVARVRAANLPGVGGAGEGERLEEAGARGEKEEVGERERVEAEADAG